MQVILQANGLRGAEKDWHAINWRKVFSMLKNLRCRIFRAAKEGNYKKLRSLQKLMLRSYANIVASVRKITQINTGRNTPGVDKVTVKTAAARMRMVNELLTHQPWKAKPARRIYIPKNGGQRPLGIPVLKDRCLQTMTVNALEPEWEARFEASSYGFRPGRSCHDAIELIFCNSRAGSSRKWVIDADISGAFDNIDHDYLLSRIGNFPAKAMIKQWLKAGYLEGVVFHKTEKGTPQGGSCSPLLANIALHGMEELLNIRCRPRPSGEARISGECRIVRYADDFVILCKTKDHAEETLEIIRHWLKERGLELSSKKTSIVHLSEGFDFLGFNIRQYPSKLKTGGFKTLIKPSKKSVQELKNRLKSEWLRLKASKAALIVQTLNPIVRGWANYFRSGVSKRVFNIMDTFMFTRAWRYAKRMHANKGAQWRIKKYWGRLNLNRNDQWVFGYKKTGVYLFKFVWTKIERHILLRGTASPDDPKLKAYWKMREKAKIKNLLPSNQKIAIRQAYVCPVCKTSLFEGEQLHTHHVIPKEKGGKDTYLNLRLIHENCHRQLHSKSYYETATRSGLLRG
jgi:RNA-directed DNA polymerase